MNGSVKLLKKVLLLEDDNRLLQRNNEELMRKFSQQKTVVVRSTRKLKKSSATLFGMVRCIRRAFPKWILREISELDYFIAHLRRNWALHSEQTFVSRIVTGDKNSVALLNLSSVVSVFILRAATYVQKYVAIRAGGGAL